ncbi:zinc finger and BTB domain-containing protein 32 isoform X3 [Canis lupus familiaris]|uniref:zinc finger and BTB domain-containing protein 32 isoform X3 n=2 Tax=Canis lupus familiaris TaxID=9615 RepID=UPI0018F4E341|nr:zinc finger and BTB domain-containing protein 32 isoform X3 [Canis lupus familiaris]
MAFLSDLLRLVPRQGTMPLCPTRLPSPYCSDRLVRLAARLRPALCDTLITVGSQEFPAHSLVLAGVSQQLGRRGRWALVKGISPSTFAQLLYFVYGESVELQPGELGPLEEAARTLGVQSLEEACRRARQDRARELGTGLKEHQEEPEKPIRGSERGLEGHGNQRPEKFVRAGWREQEALHEQRPQRERPERAEAMQEGSREQMRSKEKFKQSPVGHGGTDGKQEVIMWVTESPGGSEESLREFPGPFPPPGCLQSSVVPRPWWAEAPWLGEGQPALWSILLLPPRYGTPFSHSTAITGAWQEVWPQDQRKGLARIPGFAKVNSSPPYPQDPTVPEPRERSLEPEPVGLLQSCPRSTCHLCGSCEYSRPITPTTSPTPTCSVQAPFLFCLWKKVLTQASDGDALPSPHRPSRASTSPCRSPCSTT